MDQSAQRRGYSEEAAGEKAEDGSSDLVMRILNTSLRYVSFVVFCLSFFLFFKFVLMFISERERETELEWGRDRERVGDTENPKQAPGSEPSAQSPRRGLNSQTVRS